MTRGATLSGVVVALAIVMIGVLALFGTLATSLVGSATTARLGQAELRAANLLETLRRAPVTALECLSAGGAFSRCGAFTVDAASGQRYAIVEDPASPVARDGTTRTSFVARHGRLWDLQVTIGWNDDGSARHPTHFVTLRSAVFR